MRWWAILDSNQRYGIERTGPKEARPVRLKNFAALKIGTTLRKVDDRWIIKLARSLGIHA